MAKYVLWLGRGDGESPHGCPTRAYTHTHTHTLISFQITGAANYCDFVDLWYKEVNLLAGGHTDIIWESETNRKDEDFRSKRK